MSNERSAKPNLLKPAKSWRTSIGNPARHPDAYHAGHAHRDGGTNLPPRSRLQAPAQRSKIAYLRGVVEAYLRDLKGTLDGDPDQARALVAKLVGTITLRQKNDRLWAEMQGNLAGLLEIDEQVGNAGAGRGI
jgi:hypothetical protein